MHTSLAFLSFFYQIKGQHDVGTGRYELKMARSFPLPEFRGAEQHPPLPPTFWGSFNLCQPMADNSPNVCNGTTFPPTAHPKKMPHLASCCSGAQSVSCLLSSSRATQPPSEEPRQSICIQESNNISWIFQKLGKFCLSTFIT